MDRQITPVAFSVYYYRRTLLDEIWSYKFTIKETEWPRAVHYIGNFQSNSFHSHQEGFHSLQILWTIYVSVHGICLKFQTDISESLACCMLFPQILYLNLFVGDLHLCLRIERGHFIFVLKMTGAHDTCNVSTFI